MQRERDIISIRLSAIIGSTSLSVYLDNLVPITDKIKHKFFRLKHRNSRFNLDEYTIPHKNRNLSVIIIIIYNVYQGKFCYDIN